MSGRARGGSTKTDPDPPQPIAADRIRRVRIHRAAPIDPARTAGELSQPGAQRTSRACYEAPSAAPHLRSDAQIGEIESARPVLGLLNEADEATRALAQDIGGWEWRSNRNGHLRHHGRCANRWPAITAGRGCRRVHLIADPLETLMHELAGRARRRRLCTTPQFDGWIVRSNGSGACCPVRRRRISRPARFRRPMRRQKQ